MKPVMRHCEDCGAYKSRNDDEGTGHCHRNPIGVDGWPSTEDVGWCRQAIPMTHRQKAFRAAREAVDCWEGILREAKRDVPMLAEALAAAEVFALGDCVVVRVQDDRLAVAEQPLHRAWLLATVQASAIDGRHVGLRVERFRPPQDLGH